MEKCIHCGNVKNNSIKKTFWLGFRKLECSKCKGISLLPLLKSTKNLYYFICIFFGLGFITSLSNGEVTIPGLLIILPIIALVKNKNLEDKLSNINN